MSFQTKIYKVSNVYNIYHVASVYIVYSYNLHKHTKYKNLIKEISPIDLTDLMKLILKESRKSIAKAN